MDTLAAGPDHGPQGVEEGGAAVGVLERGVAARDLGDIGVGPQADRGEAAAEHRADPLTRAGGERR